MRLGSVGKAAIVVSLLAMISVASDGWTREGPYYQTSLTARMTRKLVRGTANTLFGWCEIVRNVHMGIEDIDPFTGTIVGLVRGTGQAIVRTSWGVWEVVTFPIPIPSEYRNLVQPEFVWEDFFNS